MFVYVETKALKIGESVCTNHADILYYIYISCDGTMFRITLI